MKLEKTGTNHGALCKIELVDVDDVDTVPQAYYGSTVASVTLEAGKVWEEVYHTQDTAHFIERAEGEMYELIVSWKVPKDSANSLGDLLKYRTKRYLARITDMNMVQHIVGTLDEPCRVMHTMRDKGANMRDSNHYAVELRITRMEASMIQIP